MREMDWPRWRDWLKLEDRCLVPANSFVRARAEPGNQEEVHCLSTDPQFVDKLRDIVGLYVDPPAHAVVLSVDEKRSHGEWIATDALAE